MDITTCMPLPTKKGILSCAQLANSTLFIFKNNSHKNILNKAGPKTDS